jgi:uncharacterized protein YbcV (DUF1398 family)
MAAPSNYDFSMSQVHFIDKAFEAMRATAELKDFLKNMQDQEITAMFMPAIDTLNQFSKEKFNDYPFLIFQLNNDLQGITLLSMEKELNSSIASKVVLTLFDKCIALMNAHTDIATAALKINEQLIDTNKTDLKSVKPMGNKSSSLFPAPTAEKAKIQPTAFNNFCKSLAAAVVALRATIVGLGASLINGLGLSAKKEKDLLADVRKKVQVLAMPAPGKLENFLLDDKQNVGLKADKKSPRLVK